MTRAELDKAFDEAAKRKSAALAVNDGATVVDASKEILRLARDIAALVNAAGKPQKPTADQDAALFWAAYHPVKFAAPGQGAAALVAFADEAERLAAFGHAFTPKERKIVDGLPFAGVEELFLRWKKRIEDDGYADHPETNVKILFDWYRAHPDAAVPEAFIDFLAAHLACDRHWFPFYYGELLTRLGRGAEQEPPRVRDVREKPTDFRRWMALADCYAAVPRRIVACLAKALRCTLLPAEEAPQIRAALEARLRAALELEGRPVPAVFDDAFLAKAAASAEAFLVSSVPVVPGVYENERRAKDGQKLAVIWYRNGMNVRVCVLRPTTPELQRLKRGASVDLRMTKRGDVDEVIAVAPARRPAWDGWEPFRAVVAHVDRKAGESTLALDEKGTTATLVWKKWPGLEKLAAGRQVFVRSVVRHAGEPAEIVSLAPAPDEAVLPFVHHFEGKMRRALGAKFGFCGDVYVPGELAVRFMDGNPVSGLAVARLDRKRNRLEWSAVRFDKDAFYAS